MSPPTDRNRLDEEASPYLRQHADNPVNWQPWDEEALAAARERDVPIFLSVGYSACHWCHVMEEESFDDESTAELLNEKFVPIKVDREERPDVDRIYQTICQIVAGQGGWPLSVWLTPDGRPFYVGTYFPPERKHGRPSFTELLERLANAWEHDRETIEERADEWTRAAKGELESTPESDRDPDDPVLDVAKAALRGADRQHGGWGNGPKFPQPSRIEALFVAGERTGESEYREVATETLDAMADGGLYDQIGGGFHRYATDNDWTVPHFEKMLYDNAELPRAYLAGYQVTGERRYATVALETFAFLQRELSHPEGGFYSTLDARSPQLPSRTDDGEPGADEEGAFYTWTPAEVYEVLDDDLAELVCDRYGITEHGNFEGTTVLTLASSIEELAADYALGHDEIEKRLDEAREQLRTAREERPRPRRDEKVLASWNGLAIRAFAEGAIVLDDSGLADRAVEALSFVREHLWDGSRLARRYKEREDGAIDVAGDGYLEDYAFLGRGALACYEATGNVEYLAFAIDLAEAIEASFWDEDDGTLYFTPAEGEGLIARPQEPRDQSTPSSLGVAVDLFVALDPFVDHDRFAEIAEAVLDVQGARIAGRPLEHATLGLAAGRSRDGSTEITLVADERPDEWREWLADRYVPLRLLAQRPPTGEGLSTWLDVLGLEEAPPIWAGREADDGETVYVCRNFACSPPCSGPAEADEWLDDGADGDVSGGAPI